MLSAGVWRKNQPNTILFVMVDANGSEIPGLGSSFVLQISKTGSAFAAGAGNNSEVGMGWYKYVSTAGEADTSGPIAILVTGAGAIQQNLEYVVEERVETAVEFTYTVTSTAGNVPLEGVKVTIYADALGAQIVWNGWTDALGVARDTYGNKPRLEPGTYYFWRFKTGYAFANPDIEAVS